eukprot:TRINITY_DN9819_c0_g1_i1.p1 TRINITY_DN9819_c0_g1~~TRINITY_DN9819_c0_g1_i1.p1  ORF type:complete len:630 (-),score=89.28 TRINITY_DN9819_c0_g1_i1:133-1755(-)
MPLFESVGLAWIRSWEARASAANSGSADAQADVAAGAGMGATTSMAPAAAAAATAASAAGDLAMRKVAQALAASAAGTWSARPEHGWPLDRRETESRLTHLVPSLDATQRALVFQRLDANYDGVVSGAEWRIATDRDGSSAASSSAAAPWTSTSTAPNLDVPIERFQHFAERWAGGWRQACTKMDLDSSQEISLDEFVESFAIIGHVDRGNARQIFTVLDGDGNGRISHAECLISADWLRERVQSLPSPKKLFGDLDADGNAKLDSTEFEHLGSMLDPEVPAGMSGPLLHELDIDGNDALDVEELFGAHRTSSTTQTTTTSSATVTSTSTTSTASTLSLALAQVDASSSAEPLSDDELQQYRHISAIIQGRTVLVFEIPRNASVPGRYSMGPMVADLFRDAFEAFAECSLQVQDSGVETGDFAEEQVGIRQRAVFVHWEVDTRDGGGLQRRLVKDAKRLRRQIGARLERGGEHWLQGTFAQSWTHLTAQYYGPGALTLARGHSLQQHLGQRYPGAQCEDGTMPFTFSPHGASGKRTVQST